MLEGIRNSWYVPLIFFHFDLSEEPWRVVLAGGKQTCRRSVRY